MKKINLLLLTIGWLCTSQAQSTIGFKLGANISNLKSESGNVSLTYDARTGFHGGIFITIPAAKNFSVQPEFIYSMEGADFNTNNSKLALNYLNIPFMFRYARSGFAIEAGPQLSFIISAKENNRDASGKYEELSIGAGAGIEYRLKQGAGFYARYNFGLTDIAKDGNADVTTKSNVIQLGITLSLLRK